MSASSTASTHLRRTWRMSRTSGPRRARRASARAQAPRGCAGRRLDVTPSCPRTSWASTSSCRRGGVTMRTMHSDAFTDHPHRGRPLPARLPRSVSPQTAGRSAALETCRLPPRRAGRRLRRSDQPCVEPAAGAWAAFSGRSACEQRPERPGHEHHTGALAAVALPGAGLRPAPGRRRRWKSTARPTRSRTLGATSRSTWSARHRPRQADAGRGRRRAQQPARLVQELLNRSRRSPVGVRL